MVIDLFKFNGVLAYDCPRPPHRAEHWSDIRGPEGIFDSLIPIAFSLEASGENEAVMIFMQKL